MSSLTKKKKRKKYCSKFTRLLTYVRALYVENVIRIRAYVRMDMRAVAFTPPLYGTYRDVIKYLRTSEKEKKINQMLLMRHSLDLQNRDDSLTPSDLLVLRSILFFCQFFAASFRLSKGMFPSLGYQGISGKTKSKLIESAYRKFPDALQHVTSISA